MPSKKISKFGFWLRFVAICFSLVMTLSLISVLRGNHKDSFLTSLGFSNKSQVFNWCIDRVQSMTLHQPQRQSIREEDGQWVIEASDKAPLKGLKVEKWLGKYCQIEIEKLKSRETEVSLTPLLKILFINGDQVTFYDRGNDTLQVQDQVFKSKVFLQGIKELLDFNPFLR